MNKWNYETHALIENKKAMGFIIIGETNNKKHGNMKNNITHMFL